MRGVVVDDETLTNAVRDYAAQNSMNIDQFIVALGEEGISYRGFRDQVRRQLTLDRVQREVVNRRVYVTEQDIDELLASPFFAEQISDEYRIGHILLPVEQGASGPALQAVRTRADALVAELRDGADFAALAVEHSAAPTALEGGDLGWRKASRLPSLFAEEVLELAVGDVAEPLRDGSGLHIVQLLDKRGASQQTSSETLVRHILLEPSAIRTDDETRAAVEDLRARILAGEDFAALAIEHSEDPGSALVGGDLGWSTADGFVREFQEAMAGTAEGELSPAFKTEFGWHVLQVQGRREQDASDEARRDYAVRVLHAQRFDDSLQEWLKEIRDEAFVEERMALGEDGGEGGRRGRTSIRSMPCRSSRPTSVGRSRLTLSAARCYSMDMGRATLTTCRPTARPASKSGRTSSGWANWKIPCRSSVRDRPGNLARCFEELARHRAQWPMLPPRPTTWPNTWPSARP